MKTTFIKTTSTTNTGGGIMVDLVELKDGKVISITDEVLIVWPSMEDYEDDNTPIATVQLNEEMVYVFNVTDQIIGSPIMTRAQAEQHILKLRLMYDRQGYYKRADGVRITPSEVELEIRTA